MTIAIAVQELVRRCRARSWPSGCLVLLLGVCLRAARDAEGACSQHNLRITEPDSGKHLLYTPTTPAGHLQTVSLQRTCGSCAPDAPSPGELWSVVPVGSDGLVVIVSNSGQLGVDNHG